ncbi:TonB-dependent receptor domain-containing protein [Rheinheimera sp. MMS21-TC3]|uniref:TonB-dependent receptor domain-containing protein n=1 Tax=Rheinheimera sp. MMS21-TC3 TaxID=3072790 RepID=UPI0028C383B4|nr:TonB-dependent receptor [Rheinheimera sp. MMS21-TC3]WNO59815.1 TonB-dependent receptor [Rheinheimera sp. MMS21-TC3]
MNNKAPSRLLFKTTLISSLLGSLAFTAQAQETGVEPRVERIEVTGSRIKRTDLEGVAPVSIITAAEIELSGFSNVEEVLQASVANAGRTIEGNESSWTQGASTVNLRGMGANRTLVLINGKRVPQYPAATGGSSNFVDTSTFPTSAVDRIEILTGGASAIYGSDAIGGVVNIILKQRYDGSTLNLRHENPQHGGRDRTKASLTSGFETKLGQTMLVLEYSDDEMLRSGQREFTQIGGPDGTGKHSSTSAFLRDYKKVFHDDTYVMATQEQCNDLFAENAVWNDTESRYKCRVNNSDIDGLHTAKKEYNLVLNQSGELNQNWQYSLLLQGSNKDSVRGNGQKSISPTFYMNKANPGEYSYDAADFASSEEFRVYRRLADYGKVRDYAGKEKNLNMSLGVSGSLGDYDLEVNWAYGKSKFDRTGINQMRADRLLDIISFNPADSANPEKWYPMDKMSQEQVDYLYAETLTDAGSGMNQIQAILTGDLIDTANGPVQFALSTEWARDWYFDIKDEHTLSGNLIGQGGTQGRGSRKRYAIAAEAAVPLLDDMGGYGKMDASLAVRYDRYDDKSDVGGATTPQLGLIYRPHEDLLFRANAGRSFRAPDLHRMYAGVSRSFSSTTIMIDPNHPEDLDDSFESISAGNIKLTEEKGKFWNLGVVAQLTDDLSTSLDFWRISLEGAVYTETVDRILANPTYNMTGQASSCNDLPSIGYIMQQRPGQDYQDIFCVRRGTINSSYESSQGIDGEITYKLDLEQFGSFRLKTSISYTIEKTYQAFAGGARIDETKDDYLPEWKSTVSLNWLFHGVSTNLSWYYMGTGEGRDTWTLTDAAGKKYQEQVWSKLDAYKRLNLNSSYRFATGTKLTLGINNLTDTMPSLFAVGHPDRNSHPFYRSNMGYNVIGRTFYAALEHRF